MRFPQVLLYVRFIVELLAAHGAIVGLLPRVCVQMAGELVLRVVRLGANVANVLLLLERDLNLADAN